MGNDGGTIAKPKDLLNIYKQGNKDETLQDSVIENFPDRLGFCELSKKSLYQEIIVGDYKGKLYLKSELLQALVDKDPRLSTSYTYIRGLNDLVTVKASFNDQKQLICPITKSAQAFAYLRTCGCVVNRALLEKLLVLNVARCPSCDKSFEKDDIVFLNPSNDSALAQKNQDSLDKLRQQELHHNKKPRKSKTKTQKSKKRPRQDDSATRPPKKSSAPADTNPTDTE